MTAPAPTTLADLDRRHAEAARLIRRRAAVAGAKALVIGRESLSALTGDVADIYGLSAADRAALAPTAAPSTGPAAEEVGGTAAGGIGLGQALRLARHARKASAAYKSVRTIATGAGLVARGGRLLGRAVPLAAAAIGAYAVGTGGWFLWRANAYNQAAYDLLRARIAAG